MLAPLSGHNWQASFFITMVWWSWILGHIGSKSGHYKKVAAWWRPLVQLRSNQSCIRIQGFNFFLIDLINKLHWGDNKNCPKQPMAPAIVWGSFPYSGLWMHVSHILPFAIFDAPLALPIFDVYLQRQMLIEWIISSHDWNPGSRAGNRQAEDLACIPSHSMEKEPLHRA